MRRAYSDAWRKRAAGMPLTPLEVMIADVIELHPEYRNLLEDRDAAVGFEPPAAAAGENPFLHLGLHLAVREQIAVDRPPGVRELLRRSELHRGGRHGAEHLLMESLAETLWEAQRAGRAPDEAQYLALARARLAADGSR